MRKMSLSCLYASLLFFIFIPLFLSSVKASPPLSQEMAEQFMEEVISEKKVKKQQLQIVSQEHIQKGISLHKQKKYQEALNEFQAALQASPENKEASSWVKKCKAIIERSGANFYHEGRALYRNKQYNKALESFKKVPQDNRMYKIAKQWISRAEEQIKKEKERKFKTEQRLSVRKAEDIKRDIFASGKNAFRKGNYEIAEANFAELLQREPGNKEAEEWLKITRREREKTLARISAKDAVADMKVAEIKKDATEKEMMLEVERAYSPERRVGPGIEEIEKLDPDELLRKQMKDKLEALPFVQTVDFIGVDISDVIRMLMTMTGINIMLDEVAVKRVHPGGFSITFKTVSPMPLLSLLDMVLKASRLGYKIEPYYVWISDKETLKAEEIILKTYQLRYGARRAREVEIDRDREDRRDRRDGEDRRDRGR